MESSKLPSNNNNLEYKVDFIHYKVNSAITITTIIIASNNNSNIKQPPHKGLRYNTISLYL